MKKFILLLIPFILTGCASVQYNLKIDKELTINEEVNITATKDYFDGFYMDLPITIVQEAYNNQTFNNILKDHNYSYELKKDNLPYPSVFVQKKYNSLNEYVNDTVFNNQVFDKISITTKDNYITLKTNNFIKYDSDDGDGSLDRFSISDLYFNITIPYVVTDNNADKYKASTNTYTWVIDEKTEDKEIKITFDKTRIYIYNIGLYISIGIAILLIIIGICLILKMRRKNKKMNRL